MSAESKTDEGGDYRLQGGPWASAWKLAAGAGVLGLGGWAAGHSSNPQRAAYSYLFAFLVFLTIGLGSLFFVLVQYLTSARWSVTVRRTAEFFMVGLLVFAPLFVPVVLGMEHLYPWTHVSAEHGGGHESAPHEGGHGEHGAPAAATEHGGGHGAGVYSQEDIERAVHHELLQHKAPYLNRNFWFLRALIYFAAWGLLAWSFYRNSTAQDGSRAEGLTVRSARLAPPATFVFGLTLTFAGVDWIMGLDPTWFSTIFGVQLFSGSVVAAMAVLILTTLSLRANGPLTRAVTVEHYHDLGKLLFGFNCFWAYISFSQFFLIWYAGIPEETTYFHARWGDGPWKNVSLLICLGHFALPFVFLMSRNIKRRLSLLSLGAAGMLVMHVVECYWAVLPNFARNVLELTPQDPASLQPHWLDLACLVGVGGVYLAVVFQRMTRHPLVPIGDPRLSRSLRFENF
ncbi:MAG: quinol:cytochrome C oxidoreductase [Deltaproteobacteria bacterium]|nr:quinol:cytochrome C oxidoreductase [Deltaproteobacteria bacterium]